MINSFNIEIANTIFKVYPVSDELMTFCHDYLSNKTEEFVVTMHEKDLEFEKEKYYERYGYINAINNIYEQNALLRYVSDILFIHKNIILFHGSSFLFNNRAYIVTGTSGTGKTTHSKMWADKFKDVQMINDDKPFIDFNNNLTVYSSPWRGKENIGNNISAQLDSIICLKQSNNNETFKMSYSEKWKFLVNQFYIPGNNENFPKFLNLLDQLIEKTNIIGLRCNKEIEAVDVLYKALMEDRK